MSGIAQQQSEVEVGTGMENVVELKPPQMRRSRNGQSQAKPSAPQIEVQAQAVMPRDPDHNKKQQEGNKDPNKDPQYTDPELKRWLAQYARMGNAMSLYFIGRDAKGNYLYSCKKFSSVAEVEKRLNNTNCQAKTSRDIGWYKIEARSYIAGKESGPLRVDVRVTPL